MRVRLYEKIQGQATATIVKVETISVKPLEPQYRGDDCCVVLKVEGYAGKISAAIEMTKKDFERIKKAFEDFK